MSSVMVGFVAAYRAIFVAANFECVEVHLQGVVHQQATDEWIPLTEYEFDYFCGLHEGQLCRAKTPSTPASSHDGARSAGGGAG